MSTVSPAQLREAMARFATGVTVVTTRDPETGEPCGLTANAVCSVSLDPPLVLVCVSNRGRTGEVIQASGQFSVNVLAEHQQQLSARFARTAATDRFAGVRYEEGHNGAPMLDDALTSLECSLWATYPGGDHTIIVGRVLRTVYRNGARAPLLFFQGEYTALPGAETAARLVG